MSASPKEIKAGIRRKMRAWLAGLAEAERLEASRRAADLLKQQTIWRTATAVLFYAALRDELDLSTLWAEAITSGKQVLLPRYVAERAAYEICVVDPARQPLEAGKFGILEPARECPVFSLKRLDLTLVPGVAFDREGRRLGRGRGFYDRLLEHVDGVKCGVALDRQIEPRIPVESHDIRVDCILTPTRWLVCAGGLAVK